MLTSSSGNGGGDGSDSGRRDIIEYFGNFDRMEMLYKTSGLPLEVLVMHLKLMMWEDISFGTTAAPPRRRRDRRPCRLSRRLEE
jgi:hypothetical protein